MACAKMVYDISKTATEGMDVIYMDYILELAGMFGLNDVSLFKME